MNMNVRRENFRITEADGELIVHDDSDRKVAVARPRSTGSGYDLYMPGYGIHEGSDRAATIEPWYEGTWATKPEFEKIPEGASVMPHIQRADVRSVILEAVYQRTKIRNKRR